MEASVAIRQTYLMNTSPHALVISDLKLAFGGYGDTFEDYVKVLTEDQVNGSLGIQRMLMDGTLKKIDMEEMTKELGKQAEDRKIADSDAIGNPEFDEDHMQELEPTAASTLGSSSSDGIDESQAVEGPEED